MTSPALVRPQKVTFACLFIGMSSLILLFSIGSTLADWGSIELREQLAKLLTQKPFSGAGLELNDVLGWLRWVLMIGAALASSGIVFAIWTAKGHQASRVILTVMCALASLVFLTGGILGILPAAFAIGSGIYLWTPESRRWFAVTNGKAAPPAPEVAPVVASVSAPAPAPESPDTGQPAGTKPKAPRAVVVAGTLMIGGSALVAFVCGINAIGYLAAHQTYVGLIEDQPTLRDSGVLAELNMTAAQFARLIFIGCAISTVLAVAGIIAAAAMWQRRPSARIAAIVLSGLTLALSVVGFPVGLPWTAAAIAVIVCLSRSEAKAWFVRR